MVAPPDGHEHIRVRYFTPQTPHNSLAVTGGCCLAVACLIPGTTASKLARGIAAIGAEESTTVVQMRNPAGVLRARITAKIAVSGMQIGSAAYERSAQIFLRGHFPLYCASAQLQAFGKHWQA